MNDVPGSGKEEEIADAATGAFPFERRMNCEDKEGWQCH